MSLDTYSLKKKYMYYMNNLVNEANKSPLSHKYAACIICNGKIISSGFNFYRLPSHGNSRSIHAEISCIMNSLKEGYNPKSKKSKKNKYSIILIRVNKEGELIKAIPCKDCEVAIKKYNLNLIN